MIADALAVRWESLILVLAVVGLALWALRGQRTPAAEEKPADAVALQVVRPGAEPQVVRVRDGCLLGRGSGCTIVFNDTTVSKMHARLHLDGDRAVIEDLDSTNGTMLNGRRLNGPAPLARGDRIGLGANQIVFLGPQSNAENQENA